MSPSPSADKKARMHRPASASAASRPSTAGRSRVNTAARPAPDAATGALTPRGTSSSVLTTSAADGSSHARPLPSVPARATPPPVSALSVTQHLTTTADASTSTDLAAVDAERVIHMKKVEELLQRIKLQGSDSHQGDRQSASFHTVVNSRQRLIDELAELRHQHAELQREVVSTKRQLQDKAHEVTALQLRLKLDAASRADGRTAGSVVFVDVTGGKGSSDASSADIGAMLFGGVGTCNDAGGASSQRYLKADSRRGPPAFTGPRGSRYTMDDEMQMQAPQIQPLVAEQGLERVKEQWRQVQQREAEHAMPMAFIEETAAWKAQLQIIASLEAENTILRRQRDDQLAHANKEQERLLQEVEDARDKLEEGSAHWNEKQKELNRLRVLMRFSQLKRDSDKLQETYKRVDELENLLRRSHQSDQRNAIDRDDLKRLKLLEMHVTAVYDGAATMSSIPPQLLRRTAASGVTNAHPLASGSGPSASQPSKSAVVRPSTAKLSRPSTPTIATDPVVAKLADERPSAPQSPLRETSSRPLDSTAEKVDQPSPAAAAAPAVVAEADVSFSTITERMQQYLERRKRQKEEAVAAALQQQKQEQAATEFVSRKLARPSSGQVDGGSKRSLLVRPGSAGVRSASSGSGAYEGVASLGPPKSFAYIGGRMIPIHGR